MSRAAGAGRKKNTISRKQKQFCEYYITEFNAKDAAIRAG